MKYIKLFENFINEDVDFSEGFGEKLRNYIETKGFNGKGFKQGIRVFVGQNTDSRCCSYETEGGWVISENEAKESKVSFFVITPDGKSLTCYDYGSIFSNGEKSTLLESFNSKFNTECEIIQLKTW
jgi:hypothetical protein